MNIITTDEKPYNRSFGSLQLGTMFHFPAATKIYMKVAGFSNSSEGHALSLSDGIEYTTSPGKSVYPLPSGTLVSIVANQDCGNC